MDLDFGQMEWVLQVVDEVDDAVGALRLFAMGWSEDIGLTIAQQCRDLRGVRCVVARRRLNTLRGNFPYHAGMASLNLPKIAVLACIALSAACGGKSESPPSVCRHAALFAGLQKVTLKPGNGATIGGGQIAVVRYGLAV